MGTEMKRKSNKVIYIQVKVILMLLFDAAHCGLSDGLGILFLEQAVTTTVMYVL